MTERPDQTTPESTDEASDDATEQSPPSSPVTGDESGPKPAPRPRSAASRARRIGGAAAARPGTEAGTAATSGSAPAGGAPGSASTTAATVRLTKAGSKPATATDTKTGAKGDADATDGDTGTARTVTVSLPGWLRWVPGFAFAAVAVVFLTLFIVARLGNDAAATTSSEQRQKVLAAAKTCLATLNTYSYAKLDEAEAAGVKCTTGKLTSDYRSTVTNVIKKNAPRLKAVQLAKITTAGIESVTKNGKQWTVLAYGQLNITTVNNKQGRIDPFAVIARLQQADGKWVLSKVDTVSSA